jgi:uncharacterized RDD family membrane protein YckC
MSWYYASGGQQQGPVDDATFDAMIQSGQIKPADLVWKEGMANWQPLSTVRPMGGAVPPAEFPKDNAIQYGTTWVCATCKPQFVQRLKEGAASTAAYAAAPVNFAGFWIRFAAKFIDGIIFMVILGIPVGILMFSMLRNVGAGGPPPEMSVLIQAVIQLGSILVAVAYNTFFNGKYGATPGKMAVGLKVVRSDGQPITYLRAFGRAWAEQLSGLVCYIGYIIAGFDKEKRSLHDHICDTRVVYK